MASNVKTKARYFASPVDVSDATLEHLRPGQRGAAFALLAQATVRGSDVALFSLPTGYGKSELIALAPFIYKARRVLVIAPSLTVQNQLCDRIANQGHLRSAGIVPASLGKPKVKEHNGVVSSPGDWNAFREFDVVVGLTQSLSPDAKVVVPPGDRELFDLLVFDEAHHLGAPSWRGLREAFPDAAAIGFTATPYRRDRRALPGNVVYDYPLKAAVDEGYFVPITYQEVKAGESIEARDEAVAKASIRELKRRNKLEGKEAPRLLVRAESVERARMLADLYESLDGSVQLDVVSYKTTRNHYKAIMQRLDDNAVAGVAFVGVLGEGFDRPSLKIAAYHNPHKSLPVTIEFAGRVARTEGESKGPLGAEHAVLIASKGDHPEIVAELHQDGRQWETLIPDLAKDFDQVSRRAWHVANDDFTASMIDAFSIDRFRPFTLADVVEVGTRPKRSDLIDRLTGLEVHDQRIQADRADRAYVVATLQERGDICELVQEGRASRVARRSAAVYHLRVRRLHRREEQQTTIVVGLHEKHSAKATDGARP